MTLLTRRPRSVHEAANTAQAVMNLWNNGVHYYGKLQEWRTDRRQEDKWLLRVYEASQESLFDQIARWALHQLPDGPAHDITVGIVGSSAAYDNSVVEDYSEGETPPSRRLGIVPPDEEELDLKVNFQGAEIGVRIHNQREEQTSPTGFTMRSYNDRVLTVECDTEAQRDAFMKFVSTSFISNQREMPVIYRSNKHGQARYIRQMGLRSKDTVFLPDGMMDDILADVRKFMADEQRYIDTGIPWHRGYLLHGPGGTGKTTTICSVASEVDKSVFLISLAELSDDSALVEAVSDMPRGADKTIVVFEDIDVVKNTHSRETDEDGQSKNDGVTLEGLLNVLDGFLTPEGMITFMTTNYPDRLDKVLIRPGRIDRKFELSYLNQWQLDQMVKRFVGDYHVTLKREEVTPAQIVECLMSGFDNSPEFVLEQIRKVVSGDST